jgi:hypothetical protein
MQEASFPIPAAMALSTGHMVTDLYTGSMTCVLWSVRIETK